MTERKRTKSGEAQDSRGNGEGIEGFETNYIGIPPDINEDGRTGAMGSCVPLEKEEPARPITQKISLQGFQAVEMLCNALQ